VEFVAAEAATTSARAT